LASAVGVCAQDQLMSSASGSSGIVELSLGC
jgi:hypothetical protein